MGILQDYVGWEDSPDIDVKVNTIIDFWSNPCNAPYTVYVETLYPALGKMFLVLIDTSLLDIARSYLRPRQGLTRGHNRKKGRRRGKIRGIPDTADMFARMIPGAKMAQAMEYGANTQFLWQVDGIIQRGLWYIIVVDATTELLYYWAQGIKEERFCNHVRRPGLFATTPSVTEVAFAGLWYPSVNWNEQWGAPGYSLFIGNVNTPPGAQRIKYLAHYHSHSSFWGQVEVRFRANGNHHIHTVIVPPGESRVLAFSADFQGGPTAFLETRTLGTPFIDGGEGFLELRGL